MGTAIVVNWWALAIRGAAGILLGIAAFAWTGITLAVLVALFIAYLLVTGVFAVVGGVRGHSWLLIVEGVLGVAAGVFAFAYPSVTALVLVVLVAAWAILSGIAQLWGAILLRRFIRNEWLLVLGGIASLVFGILLAANPFAGLLTIVWLVGAYALASGALLLALALRLRARKGTFVIGTFG